jgi:hypothetical protein
MPFFETTVPVLRRLMVALKAVIFEAVNDKTLGCKNSGNGLLCISLPVADFCAVLVVHALQITSVQGIVPRQCPCSLVLLTTNVSGHHCIFFSSNLHMRAVVWKIIPQFGRVMVLPSVDTTVQDVATWGVFGVGT